MKFSFRNPETHVLTGWGYAESNGADLVREEQDDFALEPGKWALVDDAWVAYAPPPAVPAKVTMRQARIALSRAGKLQAVIDALAAMPGQAGEEARIEWEYAADVERASPLVASLVPLLGMTDAEIDELFILAATL